MKDRTEYLAKWYQDHKEEVRERAAEASARYRERKSKEDPEGFREYRNEAARKSMKKSYQKKRAAMSEEELIAERERLRIKMKAWRERKKQERLAQQQQEKKDEH